MRKDLVINNTFTVFLILTLSLLLLSCTSKPSNETIIKIVKDGSVGIGGGNCDPNTKTIKNANYAVEIVEFGTYNKERKYWPVKIKINGSYDCPAVFSGNYQRKTVNKIIDLKLSKDDYGKWQIN